MSCGSPDGKSPAGFFSELQARAQVDDDGMPPLPPPQPSSLDFTPPDLDTIRQHERHGVARQVLWMRKNLGSEATMARIEAWADAPVPSFHRL